MGVFISGITDVSYFLSDKVQLGRRNLSLNMPAMDYKNDGPMVKDMVNELISSWARLKCNNLVTDLFIERLFHATGGMFGTTVSYTHLTLPTIYSV